MLSRTDPIELLLPGADGAAQAHARRVVTVLRLLADDARSSRAASVHVDLSRARAALVADARVRLRRALVELVAVHLASAIGHGTFCAAFLPEADADWGRAWSALDALRDEHPDLPAPPAPDEPALAVAVRLVDALGRVDGAEARASCSEPAALERALWRGWLARAEGGPRAGERALRAVLERARSRPAEPAAGEIARDALAATVACILDRGAVREAATALDEAGVRAGERDERLARLAGWVALLSGDEAGARASAARLGVHRGPLPRALCDLRAAVPGWLACLSGREPAADRAPRAPATLERSAIGAAAACVFALRPGAGARAVHVDVAPAWRARVPDWLEERRDACALAGEREHRSIVRGVAVVEHAQDASPHAGSLGGVLGGTATRAVAVVPIAAARDPGPPRAGELFADDDAGLGGWLHLELEHHLVPDAATLERLAHAARRLIDARATATASGPGRGDPHADDERAGPHAASGAGPGADPGGDPVAEVFARMVEALGIRTAVRRWWGYELDGGALVERASGGGSRTLSGRATGGRRALQRAYAAGGGVVFDEPDARLAAHERSASGMVVPLRLPAVGRAGGARFAGFLALESERRRDFREADLERFTAIGERFAMELWLAGFRGWHRARFGVDLCFDAERERARAAQLFALARSRAPVAIVGPAGAGKTVLSRQLHYASARLSGGDPDGLLEVAAQPELCDLERELRRAAGGTLLIEEVEGLSEAVQLRLARALDAGPEGLASRAGAPPTRIVATSRVDPARAGSAADDRAGDRAADRATGGAEPRLVDALARRLDRLRLWTPPLCERRDEIPALLAFLAARFAEEEGLARVRPSDEATALLWRQPWHGNLRELEGLVHKLALLHAGSAIGPDEVQATALRFRLELLPRLPSRRPDPAAVRAALDVTRTAGGRINKTRAALYLGWDPDTLVTRLAELGIDGDADRGAADPEAPE